jgi:hypothetical protein
MSCLISRIHPSSAKSSALDSRTASVSVSSVSATDRRDSTEGCASRKCAIGTRSADASLANSSASIRRVPDSIFATMVRSSPTEAARSLCDMPTATRAAWTRSPIPAQSC